MPGVLSQAGLVSDTWLSAQLGRAVHRLEIEGLATLGAQEAFAALAGPIEALAAPAMVYAKVPPRAVGLGHALERAGFRLVDTNVTLERGRLAPARRGRDLAIRPARPEDERPVVSLARRSFRSSRFHLDPAIGDEIANEIKAQWVGNYFRGKRGNALVVAEVEKEIAGFLLALEAPDGAVVVDLVATDEEHRGRGIAGDMTRLAQEQFLDASRLRVGTQIANGPALRAYERLGFAVAGAAYVFHLHLPS
ncbi:MAG: GNAT family N-acetyltransferase [Planctomycetota bacterium]|jgi:ribosomal protein S18 acetylase RimI-like enzyme